MVHLHRRSVDLHGNRAAAGLARGRPGVNIRAACIQPGLAGRPECGAGCGYAFCEHLVKVFQEQSGKSRVARPWAAGVPPTCAHRVSGITGGLVATTPEDAGASGDAAGGDAVLRQPRAYGRLERVRGFGARRGHRGPARAGPDAALLEQLAGLAMDGLGPPDRVGAQVGVLEQPGQPDGAGSGETV